MNIQTVRYSNEKNGKGTRKSISQHVNYIFRDFGKDPSIDKFICYRNISPKHQHPEGVIRAFEANEAYRKQKNQTNQKKGHRLNSIHSYDEIISISPEDREYVLDNLWIMQDLFHELAHKIAPGGVWVFVVHVDKQHIHGHAYRHAFSYKSHKPTRTDNQTFVEVRKHLEQVQQERYPQLKTPLIYQQLEAGMKAKKQGRSKGQKKRLKLQERNQISDRALMGQAVRDFHRLSDGLEGFYRMIKSHNIKPYYRGDVQEGVHKNIPGHGEYTGVWCNGRKYRFTSLGIANSDLERLRQRGQERELAQKEREAILDKYAPFHVPSPPGKEPDRER